VLGFGLDLTTPGGSLALTGTELGPAWIPVGSADGDGLSGVSLSGLSGSDILLARLEFEAAFAGAFELTTAITPGDLGEGFALEPVGFDLEIVHASALVTIVPEPGVSWLAAWGLLALLRRRRFRV
jgi:hypothetical protein